MSDPAPFCSKVHCDQKVRVISHLGDHFQGEMHIHGFGVLRAYATGWFDSTRAAHRFVKILIARDARVIFGRLKRANP